MPSFFFAITLLVPILSSCHSLKPINRHRVYTHKNNNHLNFVVPRSAKSLRVILVATTKASEFTETDLLTRFDSSIRFSYKPPGQQKVSTYFSNFKCSNPRKNYSHIYFDTSQRVCFPNQLVLPVPKNEGKQMFTISPATISGKAENVFFKVDPAGSQYLPLRFLGGDSLS